MTKFRAEVIAIGDEMTSGQRLDTNTQWLSQQLGDLGIEVAFHSTVGDDLQDNIDVFRIAATRADIVISTGGLGPTQDDLTRQALADMAGVELVFHPAAWERIQEIFAHYKREIPANNKVQAYVPQGSTLIPNPEGTAPGIDLEFARADQSPSRIFSVPGVPAEMKQMWNSYVQGAIRKLTGHTGLIHHHVLHCFGVGESRAEEMVPDLIRRGREPRVGITASSAVISFRVTARDESRIACEQQMQPTIETIRSVMGDFIFGENGQTLEQVTCDLMKTRGLTMAIVDLGLNGDVARAISGCDSADILLSSKVAQADQVLKCDAAEIARITEAGETDNELIRLAKETAVSSNADLGLVIGPVDRDEATVRAGNSKFFISAHGPNLTVCDLQRLGGRSAMRERRAVNQVLNTMRLNLK